MMNEATECLVKLFTPQRNKTNKSLSPSLTRSLDASSEGIILGHNTEEVLLTNREIEHCLQRGADCLVLVEMEFLELQPLLHVLIERGDVANVQRCLEHASEPLHFTAADASGSTAFHVLSRSRNLPEGFLRTMLQLLVWRLQTHPTDEMCWSQTDMDGLDILSSAARYHRLAIFWEALREMPYFEDRTTPHVIRVPVFLWDWKALGELDRDAEKEKEKGFDSRGASSSPSCVVVPGPPAVLLLQGRTQEGQRATSSTFPTNKSSIYENFILQKGLLPANEALSRVCHWKLYDRGANASSSCSLLSAAVTEMVDMEEARVVRHCVLEEGADVLYTPRARVLPCLHQLILNGAVACFKACLETPARLRVNYTEWDDPRCKPFYRPGILGTRLVDCLCRTTASNAAAVSMLSALLDRFERQRHGAEPHHSIPPQEQRQQHEQPQKQQPKQRGEEEAKKEGGGVQEPSVTTDAMDEAEGGEHTNHQQDHLTGVHLAARRDLSKPVVPGRPSIFSYAADPAKEVLVLEEDQVVWYTAHTYSSDSNVVEDGLKDDANHAKGSYGRGLRGDDDVVDSMRGGNGVGVGRRSRGALTTTSSAACGGGMRNPVRERRRAHPDFLSAAAEDGRLGLFWPLVKPFVCRQLWRGGREAHTGIGARVLESGAGYHPAPSTTTTSIVQSTTTTETVIIATAPAACIPSLDSPPPGIRLALIRGVVASDWAQLSEQERTQWFFVEHEY